MSIRPGRSLALLGAMALVPGMLSANTSDLDRARAVLRPCERAGASSTQTAPPIEKKLLPRKPPPRLPSLQRARRQDRKRRSQPSESPLTQVSYGGARPLGLRYGFLRKAAGEEYEEVNADSVFHAGDRIRFSVQTNDRAYLYIVLRGSSGTWKVLFPTSEIEGGSNLVQGGHTYLFPPPPGRFAFDEQKGEEKVCLVLTRRPEESLEQLIYALSAALRSLSPLATRRPSLCSSPRIGPSTTPC